MLIVIVIIGILSAAMSISSFSAKRTADVSNIVNNMMTLKTAVIVWRYANKSRIVKEGSTYKINTDGTLEKFEDFTRNHTDGILQYLDKRGAISLDKYDGNLPAESYCMASAGSNSKMWYVGYKLYTNNNDKNPKLLEKVEERTSTFQLLGKDKKDYNAKDDKNNQYVFMKILEADQ